MEREIQTDDIESLEKWTQHPPEQLDCVGGKSVNRDTMRGLVPCVVTCRLNLPTHYTVTGCCC